MMRHSRLFALALLAPMLVAASDPRSETEHVVAEGETLGGIANRAGVPPAVIAAANGLAEPYNVRAGQKLQIPRQRNHTVTKGQTLGGIANRYGVPSSDIAIANGLASANSIRIGQKLIIPAVMSAEIPVTPTPTTPYFRYPHDGEVLLGFTMRPDGGGHDGIDFAANVGDMVRASSSGTVIFSGAEPKRFGRMVVIDHGNGWHSVYGHLARVTVTKGEVVKGGERIGIAGHAGVANRIELHFEIRQNQEPVDPTSKLPAKRN
jgi:murein DD-endopeptidase MepM/ murein hydrolase activator NlpD